MRLYFLITILITSTVYGAKQSFFLDSTKYVVHFKKKKKSYPPHYFIKLISWDQYCLVVKTGKDKVPSRAMVVVGNNCVLSSVKKRVDLGEIKEDWIFDSKERGVAKLYLDKKVITFHFPFVSELSLIKESTSLKQSDALKSGQVCRRYHPSCQSFDVDKCDQCKSKHWSAEFNWKCPEQTQRRCGNNSCGQRNEPACLRGLPRHNKMVDCEEAHKYVYCAKKLMLICEGDGQVICR